MKQNKSQPLTSSARTAPLKRTTNSSHSANETGIALLREPVSHLRQNRTQLCEVWARRIPDARLLTAMIKERIFPEATSVHDNHARERLAKNGT
jgi:hypothetical protein